MHDGNALQWLVRPNVYLYRQSNICWRIASANYRLIDLLHFQN